MSVSPKASAESAVRDALRVNNPFERPAVVKEQNIWGESFPDVVSLNAVASNSIFDALARVRSADSTLSKVSSMVITAERGVGKSHVVRRVRRRLQANSEGVFIYASADRYGDLEHINNLFQQSMAESLEQQGGEGTTQWQEIATLMVVEALRNSGSKTKVPAAPDLVRKFDRVCFNSRQKGKDLVAELAKAIRRKRHDVDPYVARAIIWTLSEERGALAVKWLAGESLEVQDAADLRLPPQQKSDSEKDASALLHVSQMLSLISEYRSVVVCFDELDTIAVNQAGVPTEVVILDLVKRLFDSVGSSEQGKGIVLVTVILPDIWRNLSQMRVASSEKISSQGKPIALEYLNAQTTRDLAALTLDKFYLKKNLVPPTPIYPFEEEELATFGKGKPFPREALRWFATQVNEKLKGDDPVVIPPKERLAKAYQNARSQFEIEDLDDNDLIASALRFGFEKITEIDKLTEQPIEGVFVKSVEDITPRSKNGGWLHFKVVVEEAGEPVTIGVSSLQHTQGRSVGAGFRRLLDRETFGLSRGCLVRSRDRKIKRYWDSFEYYQQLVAQGGEWVDLVADDLKPLLAMQYVYEHHEKFDLTIKRLNSFAFVRDLLKENPLLKEILSRPEGAVVEEALEGEELQHLTDDVDIESLETVLSQEVESENAVDESADQASFEDLAEAVCV
ncbi:MAG: ATP-binding protein [Cyanobacteria bacterium J06621_11]